MGPEVPLQVGVHDKLLAAVRALEILARGVRAQVQLQVGRVREALVALAALKGPLA